MICPWPCQVLEGIDAQQTQVCSWSDKFLIISKCRHLDETDWDILEKKLFDGLNGSGDVHASYASSCFLAACGNRHTWLMKNALSRSSRSFGVRRMANNSVPTGI